MSSITLTKNVESRVKRSLVQIQNKELGRAKGGLTWFTHPLKRKGMSDMYDENLIQVDQSLEEIKSTIGANPGT